MGLRGNRGVHVEQRGVDDHRNDFRLDDDPGTVVLLRRYGGKEECHLHHSAVVHRHGYHQHPVGSIRILTGIRR